MCQFWSQHGAFERMNWLNGYKKATKVKVSNRQLQAKNLSSFWVERWKTLETLFLFWVFVFPSKSVKKNFKRKKYIHTSYIVHNSVDSVDSWQKSKALGYFFFLLCPRTLAFCHMAKSLIFLEASFKKTFGYVSQNIAPKWIYPL